MPHVNHKSIKPSLGIPEGVTLSPSGATERIPNPSLIRNIMNYELELNFILQHRTDDVRQLALQRPPEGIDLKWCLQQIEGWQTARRKLPLWATTDDVWFPPRLSMEQCSSQSTATYKRRVTERLLPHTAERQSFTDLTGGFGVDFCLLASLFQHATYCEILPHLRELATHNIPLLASSCPEVEIRESASIPDDSQQDLIFIDPARRSDAGRKTVAIEDCTPNLIDLQDDLLSHCRWLMVKLSPMLDIRQALRQLHGVREIHVVSVAGECRELLFVCSTSAPEQLLSYHCVNLETDDPALVTSDRPSPAEIWQDEVPVGGYLYEPNASILKAGMQDVLCQEYSVAKLHPQSHLFVSLDFVPQFPGRRFRITGSSDFGKRNLRALLGDLKQANLTIRNFPSTVAQLRRQLHLAEGGNVYLFATSKKGGHCLVRCERA